MVQCAVMGCNSVSIRNKSKTKISFFGVPTVITRECERTLELSTRRRSVWLERIKRPDLLNGDRELGRVIKICSKHFVGGRPSKLFQEYHQDWAPNLNLDPSKAKSKTSKIAVRPLRSLLKTSQNRTSGTSTAPKLQDSLPFKETKLAVVKREVEDPLDCRNVDLPQEENSLEPVAVNIIWTSISDVRSTDTSPSTSKRLPNQKDISGVDLTNISERDKLLQDNASLRSQNAELNLKVQSLNLLANELQEQGKSALEDNAAMRSELLQLRNELDGMTLNENSLKGNNAKVEFYTGIPSFPLLIHIFNFVESNVSYSNSNSWSKFSEFLIVMMRIRLGLLEQDLAFRFNVDQLTVSYIFDKWIASMSASLKKILVWPDRDMMLKALPEHFREAFGSRIAVIVDFIEIFIDGVSSLVTKAETMKYLIGISPQGGVCFISRCWGERALSNDFLGKLSLGDVVLTNKELTVIRENGLYRAKLDIPVFTKGRVQLPCETDDENETSALENVRNHVDQIVGSIRRRFSILSSILPSSLLTPWTEEHEPAIDYLVRVCCGLSNMCPTVTTE